MNRADLRFFEPAERAVEPRALSGFACGVSSCFFEGLTQTELQFTGGLFSEGGGDDPDDLGPAGFNDAHDAPPQLSGFAGAGGGLDEPCVVKRCPNLLA